MKKIILTDKFYLNAFSFFCALLFIASIKKNLHHDNSTIILSGFLCFLISFFLYIYILINKLDCYPIHIFFNCYVIVTLLYFLYNFDYIYKYTYPNLFYLLENRNYLLAPEVFNKLFNEALKILILTVFFFNMGFLLISKVLKKQKNFLPNLSEIELIRVNFFLLIVKFFFLLVYIFLSINIPELEKPINMLIISISFYLIFYYKKNRLINFFIIAYLFFENIIQTYALMGNILLLTVCFVIFYNYKKRISILLLLSVLVWVFVGQSYKPKIRFLVDNLKTSQENNTVSESKFDSSIVEKFKNERKSEEFFDSWLNRTSREELIKILQENNTVSESKFDYGYESGSVILRLSEPILSIIRVLEIKNIKKKKIQKDTLSILKYSLIPRFIYKDKPKQDFSKWYTSYFFPLYQIDENFRKGVTYNISWTTDLFLNLEYKGSIFLSFILGLLISLLVKTFAHFNSNNINFLLGVSILSPLTFPDYNISLMLSPLILQYIIIFSLIKLILIFIKK